MAYGNGYQNQQGGGYYQQNRQFQRKPSFWHQIHREMMDCLLQLDKLDDGTREYVTKLQGERQPTNNMKTVVCKIFAEKMHRPNKPYTIEPWQPRQDASGYQPQQRQYQPRQQYQQRYQAPQQGDYDQGPTPVEDGGAPDYQPPRQQYANGRGVGQPAQQRPAPQQRPQRQAPPPPPPQEDDQQDNCQRMDDDGAPQAQPMTNDDEWLNS